jgi:hypothetical protein
MCIRSSRNGGQPCMWTMEHRRHAGKRRRAARPIGGMALMCRLEMTRTFHGMRLVS